MALEVVGVVVVGPHSMFVGKQEHKLVGYTEGHTLAVAWASEGEVAVHCSIVLDMLVECKVLDRIWDSH